MIGLRYDAFEWDQGNATKNLEKHGISKEEIESFFDGKPFIADDPKHSRLEKRQLAVGRTKEERWMVVSFTLRIKEGHNFVRPISARYMHAKEVSDYEKG